MIHPRHNSLSFCGAGLGCYTILEVNQSNRSVGQEIKIMTDDIPTTRRQSIPSRGDTTYESRASAEVNVSSVVKFVSQKKRRVCLPMKSNDGDPCTVDTQSCGGGLVCSLDRVTGNDLCMSARPENSSCASGTVCDSDLFCQSDSGRCVKRISRGKRCSGIGQCAFALSCLPVGPPPQEEMRCVPRPSIAGHICTEGCGGRFVCLRSP